MYLINKIDNRKIICLIGGKSGKSAAFHYFKGDTLKKNTTGESYSLSVCNTD